MFRSVRARLIASLALIVVVTLVAAGIALFTRLGGYREQLDASKLRSTAAPVYYNFVYFPESLRVDPTSGQRLRSELTSYLRTQARDAGVIVLLVNRQGDVIPGAASDDRLADIRFRVPAPLARGPDFKQLPEKKLNVPGVGPLLYVIVPTPRVVRLAPAGVSAVVVAVPQTSARQVFRDLAPRLLFAGLIGFAVALITALVLWAWIYRPLGRILKGVRAVSGGDYQQRVPVSGPSEIREVARDINAMADSVQLSQRALREFLANVSHELKTPLTSIRGFSQALLDGTLDTPEERERAARVIDIESRRLLHLVGELLDLSRIESGQQAMQLADVPAAELLAHVTDVFSIRAEEDRVDLRVGEPGDAVVSADFDRIEQVLGNLLDNAFRHTPAGGRIDVGVRPARAGFIEFSVTDSGSGIGPDELPHVFDRFYRSSYEASGTGKGLGLAISREIVRAHGGEIRAESRLGAGATFAFTLPLANQRPAARTSSERQPAVTPAGGVPATKP